MAQYSDNFNRANGGLGANWTTVTAADAPAIVSQIVQDSTAQGTDALAYWAGGASANDQFSQVTMLTCAGTANFVGAIVRASGNTYYDGFVRGPTGVGTATVSIYRSVSGSPTQIVNATGQTVNPGDVIKLTVQGTRLTLYINGSQVLTVSDANIAAGNPGIHVASDSGALTNAQLDLWSGGDLAVDTPIAPAVGAVVQAGSAGALGLKITALTA